MAALKLLIFIASSSTYRLDENWDKLKQIYAKTKHNAVKDHE